MSELMVFAVVFGGLFVLRGIAATVFFYFILPQGDRCPNCDAVTLRMESRRWNRLVPSLRASWCFECDWHGFLRRGQLTPVSSSGTLAKTH